MENEEVQAAIGKSDGGCKRGGQSSQSFSNSRECFYSDLILKRRVQYLGYEYYLAFRFLTTVLFPLHGEKCFSYGKPRNRKIEKSSQLRAQHTKKPTTLSAYG